MALDQSAAFDCVSHKILLDKLRLYRCSQTTLNWTEQYLSSRSQQVCIGRHQSHLSPLYRGVPQGSILGPFLYLVYTNEMAEVITNPACNQPCHSNRTNLFSENCSKCGMVVLYEDDATLVVSNKNRYQNQLSLNINLAKLENFLNNNELALNTTKTSILEQMIKQKKGRTPGEPPHLMVEDPEKQGELIKIKDAKNFRLLGANLQGNIHWKHHLETGKKAVLPTIRKQLGSLQQLGKQLPQSTRKTLAEGMLLSKFSYLIAQWGGASSNFITSAQRLQNKIGRWVYGLNKRTKTITILETCSWLSIQEQTSYHSLIQLWKLLRMNKPSNMATKFTLEADNTVSTTAPRLLFTTNGFRWRTTTTWNQLPADIAVQYSTVYCSTLHCSTVHYSQEHCSTVHCNSLPCSAVH